MIRLVTARGDLDLTQASLSVEINNPFFDEASIPGIVSYPFTTPMTPGNVARLQAPHLYRGVGGPPPEPCDCYVDGPLWRRGALLYRGCDEASNKYTHNFAADAADLQKQMQGVKLTELDLGSVPFVRSHTQALYALLPVANVGFYGDQDKQPSYNGVMNYYGSGYGYPNNMLITTFAPQPRLVPVLRRVMATFGYTITGSWIDDEEIQQLVVYSDRCLDLLDANGTNVSAATVDLAKHLPGITVPDLLIALQGLFCLGMDFNTTRKELRIQPLRDVLQRSGNYRDRKVLKRVRSSPNDTDGWELSQVPDQVDELDKTLDVGWQKRRLGNGTTSIQVRAGTLHMITHVDGQTERLLPAINQKGAGTEFGLGNDSRCGLRLLFDRGLQPDSLGGEYPLGTAEAENMAGQSVGEYSLRWDGPKGLYQVWWQDWLAFRSRAVTVEYDVEFSVADLLDLRPDVHEMLDYHLHLWQKVSLSIDARTRLSKARITYRELL